MSREDILLLSVTQSNWTKYRDTIGGGGDGLLVYSGIALWCEGLVNVKIDLAMVKRSLQCIISNGRWGTCP